MRTHIDLFSGIGGFALACRWAGVETIGFAEIDSYASRVLAKNFPGVTNYGDIRNVPAIDDVWIVTGGFPCQPFSTAGKRRGAADDRWLWPEMAGVIDRIRPRWILAENVPGIIRMELDTVLSDLERLDYTAWPIVIPAVGVDAPHRRERIWIVAHAAGNDAGRKARDVPSAYEPPPTKRPQNRSWQSGDAGAIVADADEGNSGRRSIQPQWEAEGRNAADGHGEDVADAESIISQRRISTGDRTWQSEIQTRDRSDVVSDADDSGCTQQRRTSAAQPQHASAECRSRWQPEPGMGRLVDGLSARLDGDRLAALWDAEPDIPRVATGIKNRVDRLRGLGNAIVPQVAYQLIRMMIEAES